MSKFFTRLGADIAKLFTQSAGDDDLSRPILGFERSNLLAEAKNVTDNQEIMDLVKQRQNANKNVARQLDNQIAKLMKAKKIEDARKKAAELARMEYEMITKSLTDQISFLENAITLGNAEAEIIKEKNRLIEAAKKAGVEFDEAEIERQIRLKRELEKLNTLYQGIASSIETGIVDALEGAINGTKTLGDVARSVFGSIQRQLLDFGVNALLSSIPGFGNFFKRANGGPVSAGQSYMVGERGPEMFVPNAGGRIVSNEKTGAGTTNIVVNVDASGSSVQGDEEQGRELGRLISVAVQSEILQQKRPGGLLA
jgi:phage-related minor tail protein